MKSNQKCDCCKFECIHNFNFAYTCVIIETTFSDVAISDFIIGKNLCLLFIFLKRTFLSALISFPVFEILSSKSSVISDNTPTNSENTPVVNVADVSENANIIKNSAKMLDNISPSLPHNINTRILVKHG